MEGLTAQQQLEKQIEDRDAGARPQAVRLYVRNSDIISSVVLILYAVDQLAQIRYREALLLDQSRDGTQTRMFEITVYDAAQSAAREGLLVHERIVLVGVAEGFVPDITLGLKSPHHRRDSIEMGLRLGRQINKLADKQRPVAPEASHQLLFAACEFFHRSILFIFTPYICTVIINCLLPTHQGIVCPSVMGSFAPSLPAVSRLAHHKDN